MHRAELWVGRSSHYRPSKENYKGQIQDQSPCKRRDCKRESCKEQSILHKTETNWRSCFMLDYFMATVIPVRILMALVFKPYLRLPRGFNKVPTVLSPTEWQSRGKPLGSCGVYFIPDLCVTLPPLEPLICLPRSSPLLLCSQAQDSYSQVHTHFGSLLNLPF